MEQTTFTTRNGYTIEISQDLATCRISIEGRMEAPRMTGVGRSVDQPILHLYFVGNLLEPLLPSGVISLVNSRGLRISVPYISLPDREQKSITFKGGSASDQFPVYIMHFPDMKKLINFRVASRRQRTFVILDHKVKKIDKISLKVRRPDLNILILHPTGKEAEESMDDASRDDAARLRARDIQAGRESGEVTELAGDPVFLARIHLRNLDLDATRDLIIDHDLTADEIQFIRTFLMIMIKNERKDRDLVMANSELKNLDELFRLSGMLLYEEHSAFDREMDEGMASRVAALLVPVINKLRSRVENKDDEIYLWEVEYRLGQMAKSRE